MHAPKHAVVRWTESWQLEYADAGLLTLCVNPGAIKTKMTETDPEEMRNRLPDRPEVAGDTIVWLSHERRDWLGGRYVSCPWDMEELVGKRGEIVEKDLLKMTMAFSTWLQRAMWHDQCRASSATPSCHLEHGFR